jgi:hypothetical protein
LVIDALDDRAFTQQDFVKQRQQLVFLFLHTLVTICTPCCYSVHLQE